MSPVAIAPDAALPVAPGAPGETDADPASPSDGPEASFDPPNRAARSAAPPARDPATRALARPDGAPDPAGATSRIAPPGPDDAAPARSAPFATRFLDSPAATMIRRNAATAGPAWISGATGRTTSAASSNSRAMTIIAIGRRISSRDRSGMGIPTIAARSSQGAASASAAARKASRGAARNSAVVTARSFISTAPSTNASAAPRSTRSRAIRP